MKMCREYHELTSVILFREGVFGLWINSELEKGYSQPCPTFDNERLTPHPEFQCIELEVWGFRI